MTLALDSANALDALGSTIFSLNIAVGDRPVPTAASTGLAGPDSAIDAQLAALIGEPMTIIDGRDLQTGFRYTLNVTNALQLRPKHWYLRGIEEYAIYGQWMANAELAYESSPGAVVSGVNSFGATIGLATCAAICHAWAAIIRMWLMGNYPLAVAPYSGPPPSP